MSQTKLLSELLSESEVVPPPLRREAIVQGHCHHKAIMKLDDERAILADMGVAANVLDSGCCGMAGAFRYERGAKYDASIAASLPALVQRTATR